MTTSAATDSLIELLAQKTRVKEVLDKDIAAVNEEIDAIERVLAMLTPPDTDDGPTHGATKVEHIRGAGTHMIAAVIMAKMNRGAVRVTAAAKLIKAAELSDGKVSSIAATLHNRMTASDDWEYTQPGTFRYVRYKTNEERLANLYEGTRRANDQMNAISQMHKAMQPSGVVPPVRSFITTHL